jgi:hypothetical protein
MQAIITKYLGPTNTRGARIKASCERGKLVMGWPHELDVEQAHRWACDELCAKFDAEDVERYGSKGAGLWTRPKASGQLPSGEWAHVFIPQKGKP